MNVAKVRALVFRGSPFGRMSYSRGHLMASFVRTMCCLLTTKEGLEVHSVHIRLSRLFQFAILSGAKYQSPDFEHGITVNQQFDLSCG